MVSCVGSAERIEESRSLTLSTRMTWNALALSGSQTAPFLREVSAVRNLDTRSAKGSEAIASPDVLAATSTGAEGWEILPDDDRPTASGGEVGTVGEPGPGLGSEPSVKPATNINGTCWAKSSFG